MKKFFKILFGFIGVVVITVVITIVGFIWMSEIDLKHIEQFCELAQQSKTLGDLEQLKEHLNLKSNYVNKKTKTMIIFYVPRFYGRHTCMVDVKNNQIIQATYIFLD